MAAGKTKARVRPRDPRGDKWGKPGWEQPARFHSDKKGASIQGVAVQVGWQGHPGSSNGQAGVQVGTGVRVGVGGIGVLVGVMAIVGTEVLVTVGDFGVLVDKGVNPLVGVLVGSGVLEAVGVGDFFGVLLGIGVSVAVPVFVGSGVDVGGNAVLVGVPVSVGVGVLEGSGVAVGVQVTKPLWMDGALIWQPFSKSMIKPKSSFVTPMMDPPPGTPSKSNRKA